jgi:alanine-glyoxylate transaminase/serine-glyoxylate transaminase/serine-pyruvate transaminase
MQPPGLSFNAMSDKALDASHTATLPKSYFDWGPMLAANATGFFPYTPATNLLFGLREALQMLNEEGLEQVFARHQRFAAATRAAVTAWQLPIVCRRDDEYSAVVTAVMMPAGHDADTLRRVALDRFNLSLGAGLGRLKGRAFRIGHLGDFNELMLTGTLCGVEMALALSAVPFTRGGVGAAMERLMVSQQLAAPAQ